MIRVLPPGRLWMSKTLLGGSQRLPGQAAETLWELLVLAEVDAAGHRSVSNIDLADALASMLER